MSEFRSRKDGTHYPVDDLPPRRIYVQDDVVPVVMPETGYRVDERHGGMELVDRGIANDVRWFNDHGFETEESCAGHGPEELAMEGVTGGQEADIYYEGNIGETYDFAVKNMDPVKVGRLGTISPSSEPVMSFVENRLGDAEPQTTFIKKLPNSVGIVTIKANYSQLKPEFQGQPSAHIEAIPDATIIEGRQASQDEVDTARREVFDWFESEYPKSVVVRD